MELGGTTLPTHGYVIHQTRSSSNLPVQEGFFFKSIF